MKSSLQLLLIEDNPADARLIREHLSESQSVVWYVTTAGTLDAGLEHVRREHWDAVLLDLNLPDSMGTDSLHRLRSAAPDEPILVLTGLDDEEAAQDALRHGAQDYLVKGQVEGRFLGRYIRHAIERHRTLTEVDARTRRLTASEQRLAHVIDSNVDGMIIIDQSGIIQFVNPAAEELFARSAGELIGGPFGFPLLNGGATELDIPQSEGEILTVEMRVVETEWDGEACYLASLRDTTERKQMENELIERREELSAILDNTPLIVLLVDEDRRIRQANKEAVQFTGKSSEELRGLLPGEVLRCPHVQECPDGCGSGDSCAGCVLCRTVKDTLRTGTPHQDVELVRTCDWDGKQQEIQLVLSTRLLEFPRSSRVLVCLEDVTERRRNEQMLVQQDRLASIGQLAAGIAHDFNNILCTILGYSQMMVNHDVPEADKRKLTIVADQARRGASLVRQVLDFSRQSVSERTALDLYPFFKEHAKLLRRTISETVRIEFEAQKDEYWVHADPTQIQQIVTNLVVNARDAMPIGGEITIKLDALELAPDDPVPCPEMKPGDWIFFQVSDNGAGIPEENQAHIFEPFFTTKNVGEGTGLGLSQVYGLVKQHEGFIDVDSVQGEGTTFTIWLPRAETSATLDLDVEDEIPFGGGETILLVEDEEDVLDVTRLTLEDLSYQVLTAGNGAEALRVLKEKDGEIAAIVADVVMPEMGGIDMVKALERKDAGVRIVLMTGYTMGTQPDMLKFSNVVGVIQKPLVPAELAQMVHKAVEQASATH